MFTKLLPIEQYKAIFSEMMLNKTDKITKISDGSVVNGIAFGASKLAQKVHKDIALLEGRMFPDMSVNQALDDVARLGGTSQRFGTKQSSTYVRVSADVGTTYLANTHTFKSTSGIEFTFPQDVTIGSFGFAYIKVRSTTTGSNTEVDALTINQVLPAPTGHKYVINEFKATGGSDREIDDVFRNRTKLGVDLLSKSTISQIEQVFMKANENVLKVYYGGINELGQTVLLILTENGIDLSTPEFNDIILRTEKYFGLSELRPANFNGYGVSLQNVDWYPVDVSMRVDIDSSYAADDVRKEVQIRINKYLDYRYWKPGSPVEWDNLLDITKGTEGIRYVNDAYFYPSVDLQTSVFKLPRIRGFQMLDLNGNIIKDLSGNLNPIYYPAEKDFSFIATVLQNI
jgi:hypothetical protein